MHLRGLSPFLLAILGILPSQAGAPGAGRGSLGLRPPSPAEQAWMDAHLIRVNQALPNRLALARLQAEQSRRAGGTAPLQSAAVTTVAEDGAEYRGTTLNGGRAAVQSVALAPAAMAYPRAVDNSTEDWFPPIGSQYGGSCASFSTTYYTMTSQVARLRGWDVKHSPSSDHLFSTRFIYNQINNGGDNGSWTTGAYDVMLTMGCPSIQSLPYIDGDFVSWPTTAGVWRDALNYRMADSGSIPGIDTDAGLAIAKQMLANGYILNYATDIGQWQFTTFKNDPATTADDTFFAAGATTASQTVCSYLDNSAGGSGHGMTIVGYNDDLWIDINGNGVVDAGEKGAFRIANSWGDWWQDGGFVWIAYDALKAQSAVSGGPNPATRVAGFWYNSLYWMSARAAYTPSLVAEFTLNTAKRNQLNVSLGRAATSAVSPSSTWSPAGLQQSGGALAFDGSASAVPATFVLDATDLLSAGTGQRWFVSLADNTAGDPGTLVGLRFIDGGNIATECQATNPASGLPQTTDNATLLAYADNVMYSNVAPVAQGQILRVLKDTARSLTLTATDFNQSSLAYSVVKAPAHGTLTGTAPNLVYTPTAGFQGSDDLAFKVSDGTQDSNTASVVIHVGVATAGLFSEYFHCGGGISLLPDLSGRSADYTRVDTQLNFQADADFPTEMSTDFAARFTGHLKISTAGSYTLYLNSDDGSKLWLDDALLVSNDGPHGMTERSGTVTLAAGLHALRVEYYQGGGGKGLVFNWAGPGISKTAVPASALFHPEISNNAPVAQGQTLTVPTGVLTPIAVAATDLDEDVLTYTVVSYPAHGTLFGTAPAVSYLAAAGYVGTDSFSFVANDGSSDSNTATVAITVLAVNHAPVAQDMDVTIVKNAVGTVKLKASDADGNALTYALLTQPVHGTLSGTAPNLVYTPGTDFAGVDSFSYRASDGSLNSNTATVKLHTGAASLGLVADFFQCSGLSAIPDVGSRIPDLTLIIPQLNYAADADFPAAMVTDFTAHITGHLKITTAGTYTLYLNSDDGSKLWLDGAQLISNDGPHGMTEKSASLALTAGYHSLRVEYYQGGGGKGLIMNWAGPSISKAVIPASALAYVPVANALPVAQAQSLTSSINAAKTITLAATDADGDALTYTVVTQPVHGTLSGVAPNLIYHPAVSFQGQDPFTFKANDGKGDSNIATVTITVSPAPSILTQPQSQTVTLGQKATFTVIAGGVAPFTYQWKKNGTAITGATADTYITPALALADGGSKYSVVVSNGGGSVSSNDATVTMNHAPTITAITNQTTVEDTPTAALAFTIDDQETPAASLSLVATTDNPTLLPSIVFAGSGASRTVKITPGANQTGTANVRVRVNDASGGTNSTLFSVTVTAVNDNPTITTIADLSVNEDSSSAAIPFTIGDPETAPGNLSLVATTDTPSLIPIANIVFGGSGANRTVKFTPAPHQYGTAKVRVRVNDPDGGTNSTLFTLTVKAVNNIPSITAIGSQVIAVSGSSAVIPFTIGDVETPLGNLVLVATTDTPSLIPIANIVFGGSGAIRTVQITPAPGMTGTAMVRVRVNDADGGTNSTLFSVTVN